LVNRRQTLTGQLAAFRQRLSETGFVEVAIVHRSAEGTPERLAGFVAELVGNPVIAVVGGFSAKAARATTPIALRPVMTQLERQRRKPPLGCVRSRHDPVAAGPLRSFASSR
jgi:hypothetical protein